MGPSEKSVSCAQLTHVEICCEQRRRYSRHCVDCFCCFFGMCIHPVSRAAPVNYANIVPSPLNVSLDRNIEDYNPDNDDYKIVIINEAVTNVTIIKQLGPKKARDAARPRPKMSH